MTFTELARKRLIAMAADGGSAKTAQSYDECYGVFKVFLASQGLKDDVRSFTFDAVDGFKLWYSARPGVRASSSLNNQLAALASLGKWAAQHGPGKGQRYLSSNLDRQRRLARPEVQIERMTSPRRQPCAAEGPPTGWADARFAHPKKGVGASFAVIPRAASCKPAICKGIEAAGESRLRRPGGDQGDPSDAQTGAKMSVWRCRACRSRNGLPAVAHQRAAAA